MFYFGYIYLLLFMLIEKKITRKQKFLLAMIPFATIIILRFGLSADYFSYMRIFNSMDMHNFVDSMNRHPKIEPLFKILSMVFKFLGFNYHWFNVIIAFVILVFIIAWILDSSKNFSLSVMLYYSMLFFFWNLSALRQGLTIGLLTYVFFNNKKEFSIHLKVASTVVAMLIHLPAIIIPLLYIIAQRDWNRKKLLIVLIIAPFTKILLHPEILKIFLQLPGINKFARYLSSDQISFFEFTSLVRLLFFVVIIVHYDKLKEKFPSYTIMFNYAALSMLLYFFVPASKIIATRITIYGYFTLIVIFPMIVGLYNRKQLRVVATSGLLVFSLFSFYNELTKMKLRSGYLLSIHRMGFETILNGDDSHFNNSHILDNQIYLANKLSFNSSDIIERINQNNLSVETKYSERLNHYSVYFPLEKDYGVINELGEIVEVNSSLRRENIYGKYIEQRYPYPDRYGYNQLRVIGSDRALFYAIDYDYINNTLEDQFRRRISPVRTQYFDLSRISNEQFIESYNLMSVIKTKVHLDSYYSSYKIVEVSTERDNYFLILNENDELMINKWYSKVDLISNGLIRGHTDFGIDYINKNGAIIWFESN